MEDNQDIESIEHDVAIAAAIDVEDQRYITEALGRSRGQRGAADTRQGHTMLQLQFSK